MIHTAIFQRHFIGLIRIIPIALLMISCSSTQITPVKNSAPGSQTGHVDVLFAPPDRPYETIALVSAKKYKPGWTDPTVSDAIPEIQAAGREVGANAMIVRSTRSNNDRHIVVECEAIRYTD